MRQTISVRDSSETGGASRYVLANIGFLIAWQMGILFEIPCRVEVVLGLYGFVCHMIFGKGYSVVAVFRER